MLAKLFKKISTWLAPPTPPSPIVPVPVEIPRTVIPAPKLLPEATPHRTIVMTDLGRGWLHSHDALGYWIQLDSGELIHTPKFTHYE